MNREQAYNLVRQTFTQSFNKARFRYFILNLINTMDETKASMWNRQYIKDAFKKHVNHYERLGTYTSPDHEKLDVLIVHLTEDSKLERARTALRNFVAGHLKQRAEKDAALVAFVSPTEKLWRFSYVKMEYVAVKKESDIGVETRFTPARRFSYIVGEGENCHTAQSRFLGLLQETQNNPSLSDIEEAFSVEAVTKEFFKQYVTLFGQIHLTLEKLLSKNQMAQKEFKTKKVSTVEFAKKLLGQIVFLYFLQRKGWLGVAKGQDWGAGPHDFLRCLINGDYGPYNNFFHNLLQPLLYDTIATDRGHKAWCNRLQCRIPFLNGGLFEPLGGYDWENTNILLPNHLFTNNEFIEEGITGTGILDVFDRYNFTVSEAEPLEIDVAIDPEMLGKVFENLIEENRRKGLGAYYTPREIVHYMCQESLINYLDAALNTSQEPIAPEKPGQTNMFAERAAEQSTIALTVDRELIPRADIETFIRRGDQASHYEAARLSSTKSYKAALPESIEKYARKIDDKLAAITVCDPAVGSGAFPVGMMTEIVRARLALTPYFNDIQERTPYHFKRHAIKNCLYGVDIDPGAVEIAKLRLWLSLVVDEEDVKQIKPLPNLDYKIVSGNSLLGVELNVFNHNFFQQLLKLKPLYFNETSAIKKTKLKYQIDGLIHKLTNGNEIFDFEIYFPEIFHLGNGFDVCIANPPYLSNKEVDKQAKALYKKIFNISDDLYNYFFLRSFNILRQNGVIAFITSDTYLTIGSKKNLRELFQKNRVIEIIKTQNVFEDPMVEPAIFIGRKLKTTNIDYNMIFKDARRSFQSPETYQVSIQTYRNAPGRVFFPPTDFNMKVYNMYSKDIKHLLNKYWNMISTSKNIAKNKEELDAYRKKLKPGDITLLGLITDGGVGLQTGDNGQFVGVLDGTEYATRIRETRPVKLLKAISKYKIMECRGIDSKSDAINFLNNKSERDIRKLFLNLKQKYGRDIFGRGYLYMIISPEEIANIESMSDKEKTRGISKSKSHFALYDKGDKEGNRWYLDTPYYIDWSKESVSFLKKNSGKKGKGMPVVRNPQFYFREGFCWTDVNSIYLKARLKSKGVYDVLSMSLFSTIKILPDWFFVCIINSKFASEYVVDFLNNTSHFQINDARQLPVIIPNKEQMAIFQKLFDAAYGVQKKRFAGTVSNENAELKLADIQSKLDKMVLDLYGLN